MRAEHRRARSLCRRTRAGGSGSATARGVRCALLQCWGRRRRERRHPQATGRAGPGDPAVAAGSRDLWKTHVVDPEFEAATRDVWRTPMVVIGRATIVGVMLLAPALGQAQLADCQVLGSGSQTYKVVMDELSLAGGATAGSAAVVNLKELLAFNLTTQLEEFRGDVATLGVNP